MEVGVAKDQNTAGNLLPKNAKVSSCYFNYSKDILQISKLVVTGIHLISIVSILMLIQKQY